MDEPHGMAPVPSTASESDPRTDDERFIAGLVLSYNRRHPERARERLLDLLGEALAPQASPPAAEATTADTDALWHRYRSGVAPRKRKR